MVARQTVVLQFRVRNRRLPSSPQLNTNLLVGCHLGWHLAAGWPLWGATEEKMTKWTAGSPKTYKEKKNCKKIVCYEKFKRKTTVSKQAAVDVFKLYLCSRVSDPRSFLCSTIYKKSQRGSGSMHLVNYGLYIGPNTLSPPPKKGIFFLSCDMSIFRDRHQKRYSVILQR